MNAFIRGRQARAKLTGIERAGSRKPTGIIAYEHERSPFPVLVINADGMIASCNPAAHKIYQARPNSALTTLPFDAGALSRLRHLLAHEGTRQHIVANRTDRDQGALLRVQPQEDRSLLVSTSDYWWSADDAQHAQLTFDLSTAETEIIRHLMQGWNLGDIAAHRGTRPDTVRSQLKSAFAKTQTNSQHNLVRMMMVLAQLD